MFSFVLRWPVLERILTSLYSPLSGLSRRGFHEQDVRAKENRPEKSSGADTPGAESLTIPIVVSIKSTELGDARCQSSR